MLPRLLHLHPKTHSRLVRLGKEAERNGIYRVAKRLQAVVLNSEGRTSGELAQILKAPRSRASEWLSLYRAAAASDGGATHPTGGHSRQWPNSLRFGYGALDLTHAGLGH